VRLAKRLPVWVEAMLGLLAGTAIFAAVSLVLVADSAGALAGGLAVIAVLAVAAIYRYGEAAFALPAAVGALVAFDWYLVPPTHSARFPNAASLGYLVAYVAAGVLFGQLAGRIGRRADSSESARSELAGEQAALRRVATLVARGESPDVVFAAVAEEAGRMLDVDGARVVRFIGEKEILQLEGWAADGRDPLPVGPLKLEGTSMTTELMRTGAPVRIDDFAGVNTVLPWYLTQLGIRSGVGAPIHVDGRLWGAMLAWSLKPRTLPPDADERLVAFNELVGMAISNTASREQLALLAREQQALREVATLAARGVSPSELFEAVSRGIALLLGVTRAHMARFEPDGAAVLVSTWRVDGTQAPASTRPIHDYTGLITKVLESGRPARVDRYEDVTGARPAGAQGVGLRSAVGAPIVVDGRLWGVMMASSEDPELLGPGAESKIAAFTELVATAIANAEAHEQVARLAEEQAALRRVATLVARGSSPEEVFAKVAEEVGLLLGVQSAWMQCYEPDSSSKIVAMWGELEAVYPVGTHLNLEGESVSASVRETLRPARIDDYSHVTSTMGDLAKKTDVQSAVGSPIVVDGHLWGSIVAVRLRGELLSSGAESRIGEFTELLATAISNAQARSDLAASRSRIVAAADDERRRVVRDLHDGAQQRLVHTVITLKLARRALDKEVDAVPALISEAAQHAEEATAELRELAHGLLPSALASGGLRAGVIALASRMPVPVDINVSVSGLPAAVEATAYFIVAEALTNVAKHAHAAHAEVSARIADRKLQVRICDDGVGGARPDGSGLVGLGDRLGTLDGSLRVESPPGGGTVIAAAIPVQ
jgi:signal transduction histidine kinase